MRWYGNMDQSEIYVERKVHHENPPAAPQSPTNFSEKSRFVMKEKYVNDYLRSTYTADRIVAKAAERNPRISPAELDDIKNLASSIQSTITHKRLKPVLRTFYNRTAFQLPGDSRLRVSLDTDLTFIREDNEGRVRSGNNWRRLDCGVTCPFDYLPKEDYLSFEFAILEVKVQSGSENGDGLPGWVDQLIKSGLVSKDKPKAEGYSV
jgi:SPX domain protein involved in polyphosphate accumulation